MNRQQALELVTQLTAALTTEPQTPAQFSEEDRSMLKDIHAAVVKVKAMAAVVPVSSEIQTALAVQEVPMPTPIPPSLEPEKKKSFWQKLGSKMKTTIVAAGVGAGTAAVQGTLQSLQGGNFSPTGLLTTAITSAIGGAIAHRMQSPVKPKEE